MVGGNRKIRFLEEQQEIYMSENAALRSKLTSKVEALSILTNQLDKCQIERDQFKLTGEQYQRSYELLKKKLQLHHYKIIEERDPSKYSDCSTSCHLDDNNEKKLLQDEIEALKQKLNDALGDLKILRSQRVHKDIYTSAQLFPIHQRQELVEQLEQANLKIYHLQSDLQTMLDDKEEFIKERDAYKSIIHRLKHQLNVVLKLENSSLVDGDSLINENRYLHDRLKQAETETQLATQNLAKYKCMLDNKRQKGTIRLGTSADLIMSHKQVKHLLADGSTDLPATPRTVKDLKSVCLGLLDSLNDKTLLLAHQRQANRILAARITELEQKLSNGQFMSVFPSQIVLQDYNNSNIDISLEDLNAEFPPDVKEEITTEIANADEGTKIKDDETKEEEDDEDKLPPQLQKLVDQAMKDLEAEEKS